MLTPIRCFSCGQVIASKYEKFIERTLENGENSNLVLDDLGLFKYCCRRMVVSHVDLIETILPYSK